VVLSDAQKRMANKTAREGDENVRCATTAISAAEQGRQLLPEIRPMKEPVSRLQLRGNEQDEKIAELTLTVHSLQQANDKFARANRELHIGFDCMRRDTAELQIKIE